MNAWVGIDPGGARTGIVIRRGAELLWWAVVEREQGEARSLQGVVAAVSTALAAAGPGAHVAVEGLTAPGGFKNGRREPIDPSGTIAAALVLGAILGAHPDAVVIPPRHHGRGALATYPAELVSPRERTLGLLRPAGHTAAVSHARSAWDVAGAGPQHLADRIRSTHALAPVASLTTRRTR